jgi:asparagine synthase (glutamine-hydrolysing)
MPGIVGFISTLPHERCRERLEAMVGAMTREPFYRSGTYVHDGLGVYAGWVCHPGSFSDCMPVMNEKRDILMIVSGENFSDPGTVSRLRSMGHRCGDEDARYLVHLYEENPKGFYRELNGWLNGLVVDLREPRVTLFNDRLGVHRLYVYQNREAFFFSSEAKSLLRVLPETREIDPRGLGEYLSCGCVLENRSLYRNVTVLPAGSAWSCRGTDRWERAQYFSPDEWESLAPFGREEFRSQLRDTLGRIVPRYLLGRLPVGISLTGGLDSRLVMAFLNGDSGSVPCYTFGGDGCDSLDVKIGRKVAEECGHAHTVLRLGADFLRRFPEQVQRTVYISDGALDACGSYELYLNAKAREIAPVRVTGNWGSELLRGARAFKAGLPYRKVFDPDFYRHVEEATRTFARVSSVQDPTFSLFIQAPWQGAGRLAVEQSQLIQRTPYMDKEFVRLVYRAQREDRTSDQISLRLLGDAHPGLLGIRTDRGAGGRPGQPISLLLRLFHEAAFKAEYYCDHGMPRWLSRWDRALSRLHYERLFLGRHKFMHFRRWLRSELAGYVREIVLDGRTLSRPFLNARHVEEMVRRHLRGEENYLYEIDKIMTVEWVHRLFLDG